MSNDTREKVTVAIISVGTNIVSHYLIEIIGGLAILTSPFWSKCLLAKNSLKSIDIKYIYFAILIAAIIAILISVYIKLNFRRVKSIYGRENSMKSNTKVLSQNSKKINNICSTRISYWKSDERSDNRSEFREQLTKKIKAGKYVRRVWQIYDENDVKTLDTYLTLYEKYDNLNVRYYNHTGSLLPEMLITNKVACVSIPQPDKPRELTNTYQFKNKKDIECWEKYFEILWDKSVKIKDGEHIYKDNIKKLKEKFNMTI